MGTDDEGAEVGSEGADTWIGGAEGRNVGSVGGAVAAGPDEVVAAAVAAAAAAGATEAVVTSG